MTDALRPHWAGLIGASLAVLAAAHLLPRLVRAPDLDENRRLAEAPAWPPRDLDTLREQADAWVADRFPPRAHLIGFANWLKLQAGVSGSPRVAVGRDGWLFYDNGTRMADARSPLSPDAAPAVLTALAGRTEALQRQGIAYVVVVPPDKETVYGAQGPAWYPGTDPNRAAPMLARMAAAAGAGAIVYPHADIARYARWGLDVYDRYDTHWTGLGAYLGYAALMRELQARGLAEGPRPLEAFREVRIGEANKPRNLALMLGVASFVDVDYPELSDPAAERALRITWLTPTQDWTAPRIIDTGQAGKPVLLLTMDSFSNAFLPFLYGHFSRIVVAHNQEGAWREDLVARFKPDIVLLEVVESGLLTSLRTGPPPSSQAVARIGAVVADRANYEVRPPQKGMQKDGGEGDDRLRGGTGPDVLNGRPGADTVSGGPGDDVLRGGRGPDAVDGGDGADWVSGGRDADVLRGGRGADAFNSFAQAGTDRVLDFSIAEGDRVEIDPGVAFEVRQVGADTVVVMDGAQLILQGVKAADLPPGAVANRAPAGG